jgi:hypothetical protein
VPYSVLREGARHTLRGEIHKRSSQQESENRTVTDAKFNIAAAFKNKEIAMKASFLSVRDVTSHPTTIGDHGEADWVGLIRDFLPSRYVVGPIFAVDHRGDISEQIDVAVFDTHYSPQWFGSAGGVRFVPIESVYAVFEVKPEFSSDYLAAAQKKVSSVRRLERTSAAVIHKGGKYEKSEIRLHPIIGGILTTRMSLVRPIKKLEKIQPAVEDYGFLNIGICLDGFAFDYTPSITDSSISVDLNVSGDGGQLIHFATRLFRQLQAIGTVPAVDMALYEATAGVGINS